MFPWRSLAMALKKIISKYTASYSSTASVNLETFGTSFPSSSDSGERSGGSGQQLLSSAQEQHPPTSQQES